VKWKPNAGGRKEAHPKELRQQAMARAGKVGADRAGHELGIPAGTVRSWVRRAKVRAERDAHSDAGLESVKAEGRRIVEEHLARVARELERYGPPPLAVGEYLSPDPYEGQRPPPGTPWPPVVPEPAAEEPVEDAVTSQLVLGEAASSSQLLNGEEPKPKKKRGDRNDDVV
jgi:transposase-like protein